MKLLALIEKVDSVMINDRIIRKKVIRNGKRVIIKKSDKPGYVIKQGHEVKRNPSDAIRLGKIQKKASKKRRVKSAISKTKRAKSLAKRTF